MSNLINSLWKTTHCGEKQQINNNGYYIVQTIFLINLYPFRDILTFYGLMNRCSNKQFIELYFPKTDIYSITLKN